MKILWLAFSMVGGASYAFGNPIVIYPPIVSVIACSGPSQPACTVHGTKNLVPDPGQPTLTNADFQSFFGAQFPPWYGAATGNYTWTVTDITRPDPSIPVDVFIGAVDEFHLQIYTSFVFYQGQVLCCMK